MANLHIHRVHALGLAAARKVAKEWAQYVHDEFDMICTFEQAAHGDTVHFQRSGVKGTLEVSANTFELDAKLGILLGVFKGHIESEIVKTLDALLVEKPKKSKSAKT